MWLSLHSLPILDFPPLRGAHRLRPTNGYLTPRMPHRSIQPTRPPVLLACHYTFRLGRHQGKIPSLPAPSLRHTRNYHCLPVMTEMIWIPRSLRRWYTLPTTFGGHPTMMHLTDK